MTKHLRRFIQRPFFLITLVCFAACGRGQNRGNALTGADGNNLGGSGSGTALEKAGKDYGASSALKSQAPLVDTSELSGSLAGNPGGGPSLGQLFGNPDMMGPGGLGVPQWGVEFAMVALRSDSGVSCDGVAPAALGWKLGKSQAVLANGAKVVSAVCLFWRLRADDFRAEYKLTHAGAAKAGDTISCAAQPPGGDYRLKGGGCLWPPADQGSCLTDVCLWERTSDVKTFLGLSHAGGNANDDVDCSAAQPSISPSPIVGFAGVDRVGVLQNGSHVYSDLCLWKYKVDLTAAPGN